MRYGDIWRVGTVYMMILGDGIKGLVRFVWLNGTMPGIRTGNPDLVGIDWIKMNAERVLLAHEHRVYP